MKFNSNVKSLGAKCMIVGALTLGSLAGFAQGRAAVMADPKLASIQLSDLSGYTLDATNLQADQIIKLKLPVAIVNHGKMLPAGSCIIKISLGSKLMVAPGFDLNSAGLSSYFRWTATEFGGQSQIVGELVNALPVNVTAVNLSFSVKAKEAGSSAITANFLITNHNTTTVLSDEDGDNNSSAIAYKIASIVPVDPTIATGKLKLGVFPNPAKNVSAVNISVKEGTLVGKYKINMYDMTGKLVQVRTLQLDLATNFVYNFGTIAAGKYIIKVVNESGSESAVLKFEKL